MRTPFSLWAMRTRLLMLTAVVVGFAQHAFAAPVYTNKTEFRIPYRFDPEEMRRCMQPEAARQTVMPNNNRRLGSVSKRQA